MKSVVISALAILGTACSSVVKSTTTYEYDPAAVVAQNQNAGLVMAIFVAGVVIVAVAIIIAVTLTELADRRVRVAEHRASEASYLAEQEEYKQK